MQGPSGTDDGSKLIRRVTQYAVNSEKKSSNFCLDPILSGHEIIKIIMQLLYHVLRALQLRSVGSGPTYVEFFSDNACQNASFVVQTDNNGADGPCGPITGGEVNSVNITVLYPGCTGMKRFTCHTA